jgi:hypothetical protein
MQVLVMLAKGCTHPQLLDHLGSAGAYPYYRAHAPNSKQVDNPGRRT